ncbi:helix-turn-helix domain-containing protein [Bacillus sp. MUM 13]|uniref:helix-turn-helix domain-containing protein n=1 Tax=Bacillus sp. MUM 13 TaxID=1678001 RepID=UPI0008F58F92|nr:helix-turn-helix domain-containing protein [Bacillus sp. MUM 13]OIK06798.1 hypothetical protein BIV59_21245 [Bacillus sp. MUM 13]
MKIININNIPSIDIGRIIASQRLKQNITQKDLSKGICSITYLSKLENNRMEGNDEIIHLICKRLRVDLSSMNKIRENFKENMELFYNSLSEDNQSAIEELWLHLVKLNTDIQNPKLKTYFSLLSARYYIYKQDIKKVSEILGDIGKLKKTLTEEQLAYYQYFSGLNQYLKGNYQAAANKVLEAFVLLKSIGYNDYHLIYHLALLNSHMHNTTVAIFYSNSALQYFQEELNYKRVIDCQIILGINWTRVGEYEKALEYYLKVLRVGKKSNDRFLVGKIYHNIGFLYQKKGDLLNSIKFFSKSLKYKQESELSYLNTIYYLADTHLSLPDDCDRAKYRVEEGLKLSLMCNNSEYHIKFKMLYLFHFNDNMDEYREYLENVCIPFFKEKDDVKALCDCYVKIGDLLVNDNNYYKKGSYYYKMALNLMKTNKQ